ncbi:hypothetical protein BDN67DRAFT_997542 [Paxillus ammoniavirescens]|nr:hypothetical protein BDN67DRAFT_997542 [Paxillus ammoniavirescens]
MQLLGSLINDYIPSQYKYLTVRRRGTRRSTSIIMVSFAAPSLSDVLRIPSARAPIDPTNFALYVLPPVLSYFAVAVLAVTPQTHSLRIALCPLVALLALRAAMSLDIPQQKFLDIDFMVSMFVIATRALDWTLKKEPLKRHLRPSGATPSTTMDAFDLAFNLRGIGWDWSKGLQVPRETRPPTPVKFVAYTIFSAGLHAFICGVVHTAIQSFLPNASGSIIDETLPFFVRFLRTCIISNFGALGICCHLQMAYDLCTIPGILILKQDPAQWPPAFEQPWLATSVRDLWGWRWHQFFRQTFIFLGGYPLSLVFGRVGHIFGAFFASAVFHQILLVTLNRRVVLWRMVVSFGMMAFAVNSERVFRQCTGKKVGGLVGWVWTIVWVNLWITLMVDGFARGGMFGCSSYLDSVTPARALVERTVMAFDAWLHTL